MERDDDLLAAWWTRKYKLPANHELFVSQPPAALQREWWTDLYRREKELEQELDDPETSIEQGRVIERTLAKLQKVLHDGEVSSGDALIDKWEAEFEAGKKPNLEER